MALVEESPAPTTASISRAMRGNKGRDTKPELAVRRLVHASGLRYRVSARPVPELRRTADLVFMRARVAVFIDGCFWHGCQLHFRAPKSNTNFWSEKINRNMVRDAETVVELEKHGWTALRFWEHARPEDVASDIRRIVLASTPPGRLRS